MTAKQNIIVILLDQASYPFAWENNATKEFRSKYLPNMEYIRNNSINLNNHHISSAACVPSRATLFTGVNSRKTCVHQTDGVAKALNELTWIDPKKTPTIGNILIDHGNYDSNDVVYIGKSHMKELILYDEENYRLETIDRCGNIIEENLKKYQDKNMLSDLGFTYLSGPDPHGISMLNAGFLVDNSYAKIAIDWLKKRQNDNNNNAFFQVISLVEPHDLVYFPHVWCRMWGNKIKNRIPLEDIPTSPSDNFDLSQYPQAYQNWVKRYDKYFVNQDPKRYRQFYYNLLSLADETLGIFLDYFKISKFADNTILFFTSDHGDLCGSHGGGYQKWYTSFEEVTHVFCNVMRFKDKKSIWKGEINHLTSHIDICPTICKILNINYNEFDGKNIFDKTRENQAITCHIQDHITMGNNLERFPWRLMPNLPDFDRTFVPIDRNSQGDIICPEYAVSVAWKFIDNIIYKLSLYHVPNYDLSELSDDLLKNMIDKNLILLYDLTNDPCESINIAGDKMGICIILRNELIKNVQI